jgi:hypothetical protein
MNQRPSRRCVIKLARQAGALHERGVIILLIQASKVDDSAIREWAKENGIPFQIGIIQGDEKKIRLRWGVKSLPWLILTDRQHIVINEGFGIDELSDQIRQIAEKNR